MPLAEKWWDHNYHGNVGTFAFTIMEHTFSIQVYLDSFDMIQWRVHEIIILDCMLFIKKWDLYNIALQFIYAMEYHGSNFNGSGKEHTKTRRSKARAKSHISQSNLMKLSQIFTAKRACNYNFFLKRLQVTNAIQYKLKRMLQMQIVEMQQFMKIKTEKIISLTRILWEIGL